MGNEIGLTLLKKKTTNPILILRIFKWDYEIDHMF